MIQALLDTDIGKDRLNDSQSSGIDPFALGCIDLGFHLFDQAGLLTLHLDRQISAWCIWLAQTSRPHPAIRTILLAGTINIVHPVAVVLVASTRFQDLALWTQINLLRIIEDEIRSCEGLFFRG